MVKRFLIPLLLLFSCSVANAQQVRTDLFTVTVDNGTAAYTAGDLVGTKLTFTDADAKKTISGIIHSAIVTEESQQDADLELILFSDDPTGTTFTDNAAFDIAAADLSKIMCRIVIDDWTSDSDDSLAFETSLGCAYRIGTGVSFYGALIARGTPTYGASSELDIRLAILEDQP